MIKFGKKLKHHDIESHIPSLVNTLSARKDMLVIYLFGSMATGMTDELSDIDIALLLKGDKISFEDEMDIIETITSILQTDEVSLVVLNNAPLCIRHGVIKEAKVLFSRDEEIRLKFEDAVRKQYMDFKYYLDFYDMGFIAMIKGEDIMMIDKGLVIDRLSRLREYLRHLKEVSELSEKEFMDDLRNYNSASRTLQIAIEASLDIGHHIISRKGLRRPKDYKDIFMILGDEKILPFEFSRSLVKMAQYRNRLVHMCWEITPEEIYNILKGPIYDLERFLEYIVEYLDISMES